MFLPLLLGFSSYFLSYSLVS